MLLWHSQKSTELVRTPPAINNDWSLGVWGPVYHNLKGLIWRYRYYSNTVHKTASTTASISWPRWFFIRYCSLTEIEHTSFSDHIRCLLQICRVFCSSSVGNQNGRRQWNSKSATQVSIFHQFYCKISELVENFVACASVSTMFRFWNWWSPHLRATFRRIFTNGLPNRV